MTFKDKQEQYCNDQKVPDRVDKAEPDNGEYENALKHQCDNARKTGRTAEQNEGYVKLNESGKQHVELRAQPHQQGRVILKKRVGPMWIPPFFN